MAEYWAEMGPTGPIALCGALEVGHATGIACESHAYLSPAWLALDWGRSLCPPPPLSFSYRPVAFSQLPMAVGTKGGVLLTNPVYTYTHGLMGFPNAAKLGMVCPVAHWVSGAHYRCS